MIARPNFVGSLDSYLARGSQTGSLSVSHIFQNRQVWHMEHAHHGPITALAWSHDGRWLASGGTDGMIHIWHTTTGAHVCAFEQQEVVQHLQWSVQGTLAASSGTVIRLWTVPETQAMAA